MTHKVQLDVAFLSSLTAHQDPFEQYFPMDQLVPHLPFL